MKRKMNPSDGMLKQFLLFFTKNIIFFLAGAIVGLLFFYLLRDLSIFIVEKFSFIQNIFGIRPYQECMSFGYVFAAIFFGNLISTIGYFTLGYLRASLPVSLISGFFMVVLLLTGTIRHDMPVPGEVSILFSVEMFYRIIALTTGDYINKNKFRNKAIPVTSIIIIFVMFISGVFYELYQLFY